MPTKVAELPKIGTTRRRTAFGISTTGLDIYSKQNSLLHVETRPPLNGSSWKIEKFSDNVLSRIRRLILKDGGSWQAMVRLGSGAPQEEQRWARRRLDGWCC